MQGIKHTIRCRCILPQYKNRNEVINHEFVVFSVLDKDGEIIKKSYAQCNNCGIVHKITDVCKSEILNNKENLKSIETIEDIKIFLPESLSGLLENYNCGLANWQHSKFIIENKRWGDSIILSKEAEDDLVFGKILVFKSENRFLVEPFQESKI